MFAMKKNNTETTSLRLITHEPLNQQDYFFMPAAQFKITTIGLRIFSSTDELTKKPCPSAVTSYRFGDVKFVTRVRCSCRNSLSFMDASHRTHIGLRMHQSNPGDPKCMCKAFHQRAVNGRYRPMAAPSHAGAAMGRNSTSCHRTERLWRLT